METFCELYKIYSLIKSLKYGYQKVESTLFKLVISLERRKIYDHLSGILTSLGRSIFQI